MLRLYRLAFLIICLPISGIAARADETDAPPQSDRNRPQPAISEGPAMPSARGSHAGAVLDGGIVVIASGSAWSDDGTTKKWLSDTLLYNAAKWHSGPALPHPVAEAAYASDGKRLYIVGGFTAVDAPSADTFSLSLDRERKLGIESLPALPFKHVGGAAAILDGRLYLAGGYADGKETSALWALDLRESPPRWIKRSPIPAERRAYSVLVAVGGQLYLLGGMTTDGEAMRVFKDVFRYDPGSDKWQGMGELPTAGYCWSAVPIDEGGRKLLVGGRADSAIHDDLWIVDLSDLSVMGIGRTVITTTCAPLLRINRSTYWLVGGEPDANKSRTARVTQIRLP
jgi:N-acetylneuraminic acid mutarotase